MGAELPTADEFFGGATPAPAQPPAGLRTPGNIDLNNRPVVNNPDGTISTVRSITVGLDGGKAVVLPTVSKDGKNLQSFALKNRYQPAIDHFKATGEHLGIFDNEDNATAYAQQLHEDQAKQYGAKALPTADEFFGGSTQKQYPGADFDRAVQLHTFSILNAFSYGAQHAFGSEPLGLTPETTEELKKAGIFNDYTTNRVSFFKAAVEGVVRPAAIAGAALMRGGAAAVAAPLQAIGQGIEDLGTISPALPTVSRGTLTGEEGLAGAATDPGLAMAIGLPAAERQMVTNASTLARARALGVIGETEAGWKGTAEPTPEQATARTVAAKTEAAMTPQEPAAATGEAPQAQPVAIDIHTVARQLAPEVFQKYDALQARKETFARWIQELGDARAESDKAKGIQGEIDGILGKVNGVEDRLTKKSAARLDDLRSELEDHLTADTADMRTVKEAFLKNFNEMQDLAPDVRAAYRKAHEQVPDPEAPPEPAPSSEPTFRTNPAAIATEHAAEVSRLEADASRAAAEKAKPAPELTPVEAAATAKLNAFSSVADDVSRKLVSAGRPREEADAAAAIVQSHYEARAARFGGAKGTGAELYAAEGPHILAGKQGARQLALAQRSRTLEQRKGPAWSEGNQLVIPGGERSAKQLAEARDGRLKAGAQQKAADQGLFAEPGKQRSLFQAKRGSITLTESRATIKLFKDADASTFIHETGHQWLEELMRDAADPEAPADLTADAQTVRKWLGVGENDAIPTRAHEKFARGFERYLMEGVAPSQALANVFAKFKAWLTQIYQTVQKLRAPINDDIRAVFDRLITANPEKVVIAPERETPKGLADAHEALAETTHPAQVRETAAKVRSEIEKAVEEKKPELADEIRSGGDGGEPAQDAGVPGGANAAGPVGGGSGDASQSGAVAEGGNEAAPAGSDAGPREPAVSRKTPFGTVPREPLRITDFVKRNGGLKDIGGDVAHILGGVRGRPGLIRKAGANLDDMALKAWDAGYFPESATRPSINEFLDKLEQDVRGEPQYSMHDADEAQAYRGALQHNAEIDRLANELGIDTKGMSPDQFAHAISEHMSLEEMAREEQSRADAFKSQIDEAEREAREWAESRGDAWEPDQIDEGQPRTLEDLDNERRQENASGGQGSSEAGARGARASAVDQGQVQEGDGQRGGGAGDAGRPGGEEPSRPNEKLGAAETKLVDKAGNIRLDNLNQPEDVDEILRQTARENDNFSQMRRGVISDGAALDLADALGQDASFIDFKKVGEAYSEEQILVLRRLLVQSAIAVRDAMAKAADGTDADVLAYAEARERHRMIQGKAAAVTAEWGRAGRAFRMLVEGSQDAQDLGAFLKDQTGRTLFQLRQEAQLGLKLNTPQQVSKFVSDSSKKTFKSMVLEYYINALISGPFTHMRYSVGNALNAVWTPLVEIPTAAAIGAVRAATGAARADRVYLGEAGAQLYAIGKGSRDGLRAAIEAFKTGNSPALPGERISPQFAQRVNAIPGTLGKVINLPSRSVAGIHSFFKALRYEQNIQASAYRSAMGDGLKEGSQAFENRIADLTANPSEAMMHDATRDALKELFMAPTDYHSFMGYLNRAANSSLLAKVIVPFMKIGTQITRNAFIERTPLGFADKEVRGNLLGENGGAARDFQMAKMTAGIALVGTTSLLVAEGLATGDGPTDPKERAAWLLNHRPNTITIGPVTIPYQGLGALGMLMRFSANMTETAHAWGEEDGSKLAVAGLEGLTKSVLDDNFMRGVKDLLDAVYHPEEYGANYLRDFALNWLPFSVGLGQTAREVDPYQRDAKDIFSAARAKIPFLSEGLNARIDMFGQEIPNGAPAPNYANDPVVLAMEAVHTGIGKLERKIRGITLSDAQYSEYAKTAGRLTKMRLNGLVRQPGFNSLSAAARIEMFSKEVTAAREKARDIVMMKSMGTGNDIVHQATQAKVEKFRATATVR